MPPPWNPPKLRKPPNPLARMLPQPRALSALDDQPPNPPPRALRPLKAFDLPAQLSCCAQEFASAKWLSLNALVLLMLTLFPLTFRLNSLRLKASSPYGWYPPSRAYGWYPPTYPPCHAAFP